MTRLTVHDRETAPQGSAGSLANAEQAYGFVPNLLGVFAESPAALKSYLALGEQFEQSSFSATERQVILITASRLNGCSYCVAAHSTVAGMQKVPEAVIAALRNDLPFEDARLQALREFTTSVVEKRGWVTQEDIAAFVEAGYSNAQILEVILGVTMKTLSNYTNHLADTALDDAFADRAWSPDEQRQAS